MSDLLHKIVHEYGWIHRSLGLLGNTCFFTGSVLFLTALEQWKTTGVWLFIVGSVLTLIGAAGSFLVKASD